MLDIKLLDTHCHLNLLVDYSFDVVLTQTDLDNAQAILDEAAAYDVTRILNIGTSLIESKNSIALARQYEHIYASIGIHPNDLTDTWQDDLAQLEILLQDKEANKIVAIGECGLDAHYPDYNIERQKEAFACQIELALKYDLPLVIHTRDVGNETLKSLEPYKNENLRGTIHCFSEDLPFAQTAISYGFVLGLGGTITYPKNNTLRDVALTIGLDHIILETDAPFLPPQIIRGKKNHPKYIRSIAEYIADLLEVPYQQVSQKTTENACKLFKIS